MIVKTNDGDRQVTGQGQGNLNTVLGAIGTLGTIMGGGSAILGGGYGFGRGGYGYNAPGYFNGSDPLSRVITKAEADLMQENTSLKSELSLQKSENYTDKKIVEATTYLDTKIGKLADEMRANEREHQREHAAQMAWNAEATGTMSAMAQQIQNLRSVTKVFIPSSNVCQQGCGCCQQD